MKFTKTLIFLDEGQRHCKVFLMLFPLMSSDKTQNLPNTC